MSQMIDNSNNPNLFSNPMYNNNNNNNINNYNKFNYGNAFTYNMSNTNDKPLNERKKKNKNRDDINPENFTINLDKVLYNSCKIFRL